MQAPIEGEHTVDRISGKLYLSGWSPSFDKNFIQEAGIKLIINCTKHIKFSEISGVTYYRLAIDDEEIKDLEQPNSLEWVDKISTIVNLMDTYLRAGHGVLVHCHRGVQRSASIVAAYLCYIKRWRKKEINTVAKFILSKRPIAFNRGANFNFYYSLAYYVSTY